MSEVRLQVKNLCKNFGITKAVQNVSFNVNKGEVHALIGENGSGKSTLAKLLNGILIPDEGSVLVDGMDTRDGKRLLDIRRTVGMAQVKDVTTIEDPEKRAYAERLNILCAKDYILHRTAFQTGSDFVAAVRTASQKAR